MRTAGPRLLLPLLLAGLAACNPVNPEEELVNVSQRCIPEGQCAPGFRCLDRTCYLAGGQACNDAFTPEPCELTEGVCAGATRACVDGVLEIGCTENSYGPQFERVETRCDGLDNDCDGEVDERGPGDAPCPVLAPGD
jgi:hypothetical protein